MERTDPLAQMRIVLSRPSHPGNIGAAARAMKTMGFSDLALVKPRHFPDPAATAMAAGAADLLAKASVQDTLESALADCVLAVGFSARARGLSHAPEALRDIVPALLEAALGGRVALVFGNETSGLSNQELARCGRFAYVPAHPQYPSLNLAAAVQISCYELAMGARLFTALKSPQRHSATGADLEGLYAHLESSALSSGFLDPVKPGRFMERMRRMFARSALEREEIRLLRGLLGAFEKRMRRRR